MTVPLFHPIADIFPLMAGRAFDALVSDIETHGLREPIWLHQDGRIIDGRNRARACERLGVEPETQTYIGPDVNLLAFVISLNLHRRHLTKASGQWWLAGWRICRRARGRTFRQLAKPRRPRPPECSMLASAVLSALARFWTTARQHL